MFNLSKKKCFAMLINSGFLGGAIISSVGGFFHWFIVNQLLHSYTTFDLYNFNSYALLKFFSTSFIVPSTIGFLVAYISLNLDLENPVRKLYSIRNKTFVFTLIFLMAIIISSTRMSPNSFIWLTLTYNNTLPLWLAYFLIWYLFFLLGTHIYEKLISNNLFFKPIINA